MNNWFKIGMPVLVVFLLIVCAVTITLLATRYGSDRPISSITSVPVQASTQYAGPALCPNCPGYSQSTATTNQSSAPAPAYGYAGLPSWCIGGTTGSNTVVGPIRSSCCGGYQN